jgi:hypothetical protein
MSERQAPYLILRCRIFGTRKVYHTDPLLVIHFVIGEKFLAETHQSILADGVSNLSHEIDEKEKIMP